MERLKIPPDVPIEHKMVTKAIERAQNQVESQNFELRKNVLKYDEVMNTQREIIYAWRNQLLHGEATDELLAEWRHEVIEAEVFRLTEGTDAAEWDWDEFLTRIHALYPSQLTRSSFEHPEDLNPTDVADAFIEEADAVYEEREALLGTDVMRRLERTVVLSVIDNKWREHLSEMDYLRSGIGLRAMGQRDPLVEYQREGYAFFEELVDSAKADTTRYMFHVDVVRRDEQPKPQAVSTSSAKTAAQVKVRQVKRDGDKVGRNDPCPCGSGRKYKRCHGAPGAEPLAG
jgi:preprotein translocase subunit SecA